MKNKELIRCGVFLVLLALLFQVLTTIYIPKWYGTWQSTRIVDGFYELPKDRLDVVLLGSSQTIMGLSPMELYRQYGISAYSFGTEEQPLYATYYWMREILRSQKPSVAVLDVNELLHASSEAAYRKAFDYMKWSQVKWEAIKNHCEKEEDSTLFSYILPLANYHSRWDELEAEDFTYLLSDKTDPCLGFVAASGTCDFPYEGTPLSKEEEPDPADQEAYDSLLKIIHLCQEEEISLLLIKTPRAGWNAGKHNLIADLAQEYGLPFLDFNDPKLMEAMNFDYAKDAKDASHLNIYGAEKLGAWLGNYLTEQYQLPDRRKDPDYGYLADLLPLYEMQSENAKLSTCMEFSDWLEHLQERYTIFFAVNGSPSLKQLPQTVLEQLQGLGMGTDILISGADYGAVLQNQGILAWQAGLGISNFWGTLEDQTSYQLSIVHAGEETIENICSICVANEEYAVQGEGIHLVVYDMETHQVVDAILVYPEDPKLSIHR
ncbi:MAG: hypothetical protein HFI33_01340 [Lachnospiraceae bacterium]|nr:hypothetical protein [Lachnospiraceae bacterium]